MNAVLKMKIWIYWSEWNSWIYFYIVLKKMKKFTGPNKVLLVLDQRTVNDTYRLVRVRHWCLSGQFFMFLHTGTLSHCEFSIYMHQHPSNTCIWSINLSVDTIFHNYWFPSGFLWSCVADNKEAIELWVPNGGPHHYFVNYTEYMCRRWGLIFLLS